MFDFVNTDVITARKFKNRVREPQMECGGRELRSSPTPDPWGGSDQKSQHSAMIPGPYLSGWTNWLGSAMHVGLEVTWTNAGLESDL